MIFLMQPGLTKVLDKYRIQKTITTGEDEFIPFIGCSFYEMEINDKLNFGEEIMSAIDNIIAKQIKYTYADLIITIPRLSMEIILFIFKFELYNLFSSNKFLTKFSQRYNLIEWQILKCIENISVYPVIVKENSQELLLKMIQANDSISKEYIEAVKNSFKSYIRKNYKSMEAFDVDLLNGSMPNLYETIYNCIYLIKNNKKQ